MRTLNLWKVEYKTQFSSSQGMDKYDCDPVTHEGHFATVGDSFTDLKNLIQLTLDSQTKVHSIHSTIFKGEVIVQ